MKPAAQPLADDDLRSAILSGLEAAGELETRFRQPLERFLIGLCDRGDGRSQEKAVEIASQIVADCFARSPSLLEKWHGGDNLEAFLRAAAAHRLKSWWRSRDHASIQVDSGSRALADAAAIDGGAADREEVELAAAALRAGVAAAERKCPEGVVFMRLKGLHGVDQRVLAECWGHHETQTSRRIKEAMELIRAAAHETAAANQGELSVELLQQVLQREPALLLGGGAGGGLPEAEDLLQRVARGGANKETRAAAVKILRANAASLAFFAQLLKRSDASEAVVVRDAGLAGVGARLEACVRRTLGLMTPDEVAGLFTPLMAACFADMLGHVAADGGTLWWLGPEREALVAVYNPREPEIIGRRQPLVSGIVSLVLATGEPALVSTAAEHARHSPAIDIALGKTTRGMIAVPFALAGTVCGVITAVRLSRDAPFTAADTAIVTHHATILGELMVAVLQQRILG